MRAALIQMTSSDEPEENAASADAMVRGAAASGATLIVTPEVTNCVSMSRTRQRAVLTTEAEDATRRRLAQAAQDTGAWVLIGSLALAGETEDGRFVNRSLLIAPSGETVARYDKIHMFDAAPGAGEHYRESAGYRSGQTAVLAREAPAAIGMTICYDIRFPALYRALAHAGAGMITAPAAFTQVTGQAHWHVLQRARAIENGAFIISAAQTGTHAEGRQTYGHSVIVAPWGEVLADAGEAPGVITAEIDLAEVAKARGKVPSLSHDRAFTAPQSADAAPVAAGE